MAATSALAVANFILDKAASEQIPITHLKLQKLIYFCYAWYAGNTGNELFAEDIEAWKLGPVVREVYAEFADCKANPIRKRATVMDWDEQKAIEPSVPQELASDLASVWNAYKDKSGPWLVQATHERGEPWSILVSTYGDDEKRRIPFELIEKVYAKKVAAIGA